jgi:hypothetical protein
MQVQKDLSVMKNLKRYRCDMHVHTCLSPCGDLGMYPQAIVKAAMEKKLDAVAICDHNSAENVKYVQKAAGDKGLTVIGGMEVTSSEEIHLLAIFQEVDLLLTFQSYIYLHLPGLNDEKIFGCQPIVNENNEVEGFNEKLLIGATKLPLAEIVRQIHDQDGLAIAAHIDRNSFSVLSQLGFIDQNSPFDALEISAKLGIEKGRENYPFLASFFPLITSSDAHFLKDIGSSWSDFYLAAPTVTEIKKALRNQEGRCLRV